AARTRLLPELRARLLALGGEQGPDAIGQALPARGRDETVELHVAHLVENAAVLGGRRHGQARYQKTALSEGRAPSILGAGGTGGGRDCSGTCSRVTRMRVQVGERPRIESTRTSAGCRWEAASGWRAFQRSRPASASSFLWARPISTSGFVETRRPACFRSV